MKTQKYKEEVIIKEFNASELKVGEMMELKSGEIALRTYDRLVSLSNPECTWNNDLDYVKGRKLLPGEGITLIQE